jgi:thiol-disulfide isomerase/thioredoxin
MGAHVVGLVVAVAALVAATAAGLVWRQRNGRLRRTAVRDDGVTGSLTRADLGADLGERATLVQFSTAFCQPCRATRRILTDVTGMVEGVAHVELDAESHLDLVRRLAIMRTPTVFVLDDTGRIVRRASGAPRRADVIAALGEAIGA